MSLSSLPEALKKHNSWLLSQNKIPINPHTGERLSGTRECQTLCFNEITRHLTEGSHKQAGILHKKNDWLASVDGDHCILKGQPIPPLEKFFAEIKQMGGYIEISTSGSGFRIPTRVTTELGWSKQIIEVTERHDKDRPKIELYNAKQYVIYTGNQYHGGDVLLFDDVWALLQRLYPPPVKKPASPLPATATSPLSLPSQDNELSDALYHISADCNREDWIRVGMALHHHYQGGGQGLALFDQWSATGSKYNSKDSPVGVWRSFHGEGTTVATVFKMARDAGWRPVREKERVVHEEVRDTAPPIGENIPVEDCRCLPPIPLIDANQLGDLKDPEFAIEGVIPTNSYGQIYGNSGSFKTFLLLGMAMAVASGLSWMGRSVKKGWVLYLCGEGFWGMKQRVSSWQTHYEVGRPDHIFFSQWIPNVTDMTIMNQMIAWCQSQCQSLNEPLQMVVIDTFARGLQGNENSAEDVGKFIQAIDLFKNHFHCSVIQVHHTGHEQKTRGRGSSALYAAFDYEYRIEKLMPDSPKIHFINTKTKDFRPPEDMLFKTVSVNESLVIEKTEIVMENESDNETVNDYDGISLSEKQVKQWQLFKRIFSEHQANATGHDKVSPRVQKADYGAALESHNLGPKKKVNQVVDVLVRKGLIIREGNYLKPKT